MMDAAVSVRGLSKKFRLFHERNQSLKSLFTHRRRTRYEEFWALRDIDFEVPKGSTFALVGSNGSGKSTLLKCLAKILWPDEGSIQSRGRVASLLEVGSGFHPELSGRENIYLNGSILGMNRKEVAKKFDEIVDFAEVGAFIDQPVKNYSSGMYVRLGFSVAIHVQPDVLVVDEILAVGDAAFQEKSLAKFTELRDQGQTIILVSHSLSTILEMCDRAAWIEQGIMREVGIARTIVQAYNNKTFPIAQEFVKDFDELWSKILGWPTGSPNVMQHHGGGVVQAFQRGALCFSAANGTCSVQAPVRSFLDTMGGVKAVGWPIAEATMLGNGTVRQQFSSGIIEINASGAGRIVPSVR